MAVPDKFISDIKASFDLPPKQFNDLETRTYRYYDLHADGDTISRTSIRNNQCCVCEGKANDQCSSIGI